MTNPLGARVAPNFLLKKLIFTCGYTVANV